MRKGFYAGKTAQCDYLRYEFLRPLLISCFGYHVSDYWAERKKVLLYLKKKKPVEEEVSDAVDHCARMFIDPAEEAVTYCCCLVWLSFSKCLQRAFIEEVKQNKKKQHDSAIGHMCDKDARGVCLDLWLVTHKS